MSIKKYLPLLVLFSLIVFSSFVVASSNDVAQISVSGTVSVNGQNAANSSTIISGSKIVTGAKSEAVVSLGKNKKVVIYSDSEVDLKFSESGINVDLSLGAARLVTPEGFGSAVATTNALVWVDKRIQNNFLVELGCPENDQCAATFVESTFGDVTALNKNDNSENRISTKDETRTAAVQDSCDKTCQPRRALDSPKVVTAGMGKGIWLIFGIIAAAVAVAFSTNGNDVSSNGNVPIVSPIR